MFISKDSIKFMMAKIFFTLAEFKYDILTEIEPLHFHGKDTYEVVIIKNGTGKLELEDKTIDLVPNSYFGIPELVKYSIIPNGNLEYYSVYFIVDTKTAYDEYLPLLKKAFTGIDSYNMLFEFEEITNEFKTKSFGYNELVTSRFKSMIVKFMRNEKVQGERLSYWPLESLQFEIENIFKEQFNTLTVEDLANQLNISIRELQRYLLKNYNTNFLNLKKSYRLEYAKNQLLYTDKKIDEISEELNFTTREHFTYFFKKETNETPAAFRKKVKSGTK